MNKLTEDTIVLRDSKEKDIPFLYDIRNNIELQYALMARPTENSIEDVRAWLKRRSCENDTVFFVIADAAEDTAYGFIQLNKIDADNKHGWLGICLAEQYRGRSFADKAISLLEFHCRVELSLRKILLEVRVDNVRAIRLYKRIGFREVGSLKQHFMIDRQFHDVLIMEKLLQTQ